MINLPDVISVARQKPTLFTMPAVINERSKLFSKPVQPYLFEGFGFACFDLLSYMQDCVRVPVAN